MFTSIDVRLIGCKLHCRIEQEKQDPLFLKFSYSNSHIFHSGTPYEYSMLKVQSSGASHPRGLIRLNAFRGLTKVLSQAAIIG